MAPGADIGATRRPETKTKRVIETATPAPRDIRAYQWRQPKGRGETR